MVQKIVQKMVQKMVQKTVQKMVQSMFYPMPTKFVPAKAWENLLNKQNRDKLVYHMS